MCLLPLRFFLAAGAAKFGKRFSPRQGEKHKRLEASGRCRAIRPPHRINPVEPSFGRKCRTVVLQDRRSIRVPLAALRSPVAPLPQEAAKLQLFWLGFCISRTDSSGAVKRTEPDDDKGILRAV